MILITGALTAAAITELALKAAINTGVGELTKGAIAKGKQLWQKIRGKVKEEGASETALLEVEKERSLEILEQQVVPFLQVAMLKDSQFAQEIQNIAQQINQEIQEVSKDNITQQDFTARDNAAVVGKAEAKTQFIGGSHTHENEKK